MCSLSFGLISVRTDVSNNRLLFYWCEAMCQSFLGRAQTSCLSASQALPSFSLIFAVQTWDNTNVVIWIQGKKAPTFQNPLNLLNSNTQDSFTASPYLPFTHSGEATSPVWSCHCARVCSLLPQTVCLRKRPAVSPTSFLSVMGI